MKKIFLLIVVCFFAMNTNAQEKQLWAKSFINQKAPELVVQKWLSEEPDTEGKFVLIDFWATWCSPCRELIPELNEYQKEFKDELIVIGISDEPKYKIKQFKNQTIEYYSAIDIQGRTKKKLEVKGIPHCIIINPEGIVVWEGWPQLEGFELTADVIRDLIAQQ